MSEWSKSVKRRLRRAILPPRFFADITTIHLAQGKILCELNRSKPVQPLRDCEFCVFSQWGEDGIIQRLISTLPIENRTFIEFGIEDFAESNCRFLMSNDNWSGFVIDGSQKGIDALKDMQWYWRYDLHPECAIIRADNVNELLLKSGFHHDLGLLSVDVDGVDYWLLEAITAYSPRILIVEYNSVFGDDRKISVPYDPSFTRRSKHFSDLYYGASLPAFVHLANQKGYSFIGAESAGVNAFFVRNDVMGNLKALTAKEGFVDAKLRQSRNAEGQLSFLTSAARLDAIKGLPVVNVETGATEAL